MAVLKAKDIKNMDEKTRSEKLKELKMELIKANVEMPPGTFIFEDPPLHTMHRGVVARIFSPRRMNGLDSMIREFTARTLDSLVGRDSFDFIADIGAQVPMRVIGMLLGIPEEDHQGVRERADELPETILVDRHGRMTLALAGARDWRSEEVWEAIRSPSRE